ncbi:MAG: hypothetical protein JSV12_07740 [Candidatus Bathyarchaeota archaeon]|nr:MAG: hypothetical protein JSV12_07740 [Candidatus Bathyarchaeota archaeon]
MNREKLTPEEKVNLTITMVDTCVSICADGIKDHDKTIKDKKLIEKLRARITLNKRRHPEV